MKIIDRGGGTPIVVIPGIQGRWEWMTPAIDALAQRCRVVTFSLADEPSCGGRFDEAHGFDCYVEQVRDALDAAGIREAAICGVSYGGLIAAAFAARYPDSNLVARACVGAARRLATELPREFLPARAQAADTALHAGVAQDVSGDRGRQRRFRRRGSSGAAPRSARADTHVFTFADGAACQAARGDRPARRADRGDGCGFRRPTLIVTGDPALDNVVPVAATHEYLRLWPHATIATIVRTGHLGLITRPSAFANIVVPFAEHAAVSSKNDPRPHLGRRIG